MVDYQAIMKIEDTNHQIIQNLETKFILLTIYSLSKISNFLIKLSILFQKQI